MLRILLHTISFVLLTLVTQVGGVVYILSLGLRHILRIGGVYRRLVFPLLYGFVWLLLPLVAASLGRVPLPLRATTEQPLQPQHWFTLVCNRHYVLPELRSEAVAVARSFAAQHGGIPLTYLDANFPFFDGFPLLPHLSHDDGRKLDLAFVYDHPDGSTTHAPALLGYGRCAAPRSTERDQSTICHAAGYHQYSILRSLARPFLTPTYTLNEAATADMIRIFAKQPGIGKLLLEPHLKKRWKLNYSKIRFHGCRAVRHDDHLHIQL